MPHKNSEFSKIIRNKYFKLPDNDDERIMDTICTLLEKHYKGANSTDNFLLEVAKFIDRRFGFREVDFCLLDREDGKYRYRVSLGHTTDGAQSRQDIEYTYKDFWDDINYPGVRISERVWFLFQTIKEEDTRLYDRPTLLSKDRKSIDQMIEGDYMDLYMFGDKHELLGVLEVGYPKEGKIPSPHAVRWLDLIASIVGRILWEREYSKK